MNNAVVIELIEGTEILLETVESVMEFQTAEDGLTPEMGVSATHIQWRYVGENTWRDLISFDEIATGAAAAAWAIGEQPSGLINGVNTLFTTAFEFHPNTVSVFLNGVKCSTGNDYFLTGLQNITFYDSPLTGDIIEVDYQKQ